MQWNLRAPVFLIRQSIITQMIVGDGQIRLSIRCDARQVRQLTLGLTLGALLCDARKLGT